MQWAAGAFRATDGQGNIRQNYNYVGTARVSGLPWWADEGRRHIHLGVTGRVAETSGTDENETVRFRARPAVRTTNRFLDTGDLDRIVGDARIGGEFTFNWDSFNFAALYQGVFLNSDGDRTVSRYHRGNPTPASEEAGDVFLQGFQLTAGYLLTGEMRPYVKKSGCYGRISPKRNFAFDGSGFGAVQLVARFQYLDFSDHAMGDVGWVGDEDTAGGLNIIPPNTVSYGPGTMWGIAGGVTWYLNPNTRIMANYNYTDVNREYFDLTPTDLRFKDRDYRSHAIVFMFQVDW
jgi:phosphate-selective porin OprO/OprP